jgi:hypothetical protein
MLEDLNPTTRCYPRTLAEAFPNSIDRAEWLHPPERNLGWRNVAMASVALVLWVCLAYFFSKN